MRHTLDDRQVRTAGASRAARSAVGVARSALDRNSALPWQPTARGLLAAMSGAAIAVSLSGCIGGTPTPTAEPTADQSGSAERTTAASPGAATSAAAESSATENLTQTVTDALGRLAAGTPKPATAQVSDALTGAGIAPEVLEVSQSRTPTGLEADAIEAAVLQGSDCIIGQVRDGAVAVTVLPVLASGKCFVGS